MSLLCGILVLATLSLSLVTPTAAASDNGLKRLEKALGGPAKKMARQLTGKVAISDLSSQGDPAMSSEFGQAAAESLAALLLRYNRGRFSLIDRRELVKVMHDSAVFGDPGALANAASGIGAGVIVSGTYALADSRVVIHLKATSADGGRLIAAYTATAPLTEDIRKMARHNFRFIGPPSGDAVTRSGPDYLEIDVGIYYEGGNGKLYPLREGMALTSRDSYAIHISAPRDCYVYVYQADSAGRTTRLFPNPAFTHARNPVAAGAAFWIPEGDRLLFLDENPGKEEILVFATRAEAEDLAAITNANISDIHRAITTMGVGGVRERSMLAKLAVGKRSPMESVIRRLAGTGDFYFRVSFFHQD